MKLLHCTKHNFGKESDGPNFERNAMMNTRMGRKYKGMKGKTITFFQGPLRKENRGRPTDIPRDKEGRPLLLSPTHCKQVKHYASSYGVSDVLSWVERNCSFAKMFLPTATCEEINTLVASCYKFKFI
uniref:DDE-1 domain-containing protein n=1 Tax=Angiostrongylus cantonensis TaxID=6313 RepID=A0A0K0D6L9_ANGCA